MAEQFDVAVIGSGPGGYPCAIRLAQLGLRTAIIERESLGGVCLNWGCIPSKAVIHAGNVLEHTQHAGDLGIVLGEAKPRVEVSKLRAWKEGIVKRLTGGIGQLMKANKIKVFKGAARFETPQRLAITGADGQTETIAAERSVIATGCTPVELPGLPLADPLIWTAKGALDLEEIPPRLAVIGGGIIGLELGIAFAKLGSKVTVIELMPQLLTGIDKELARPVLRKLKELGVEVFTEARTQAFEKAGSAAELKIDTKKGPVTVPCDRVLVSVGFRPNSSELGLSDIGVAVSERGFVQKDIHGRTNLPNIFAIGDVTGPPFLAHRATKEGLVVAEVIAGKPSALDYQCLPSAIFTDPEIAIVGLSEAEAKEAGHKVKIGRFPFAALGRALAANAPGGLFKVIADADTDLILGVGIVGHEASNLIAEAALAIEMAGTLEDLAATVHAHPTFPEGLMEAAEDALGHAIHIAKKR